MTTKQSQFDNKSGADAVREKVEHLLTERKEIKDRWQANSRALHDAVAAGRLFAVDIELPDDIDLPAPSHPPKQARTNSPSPFVASGERSIRQIVLEQLKAAGAKGVKSGPLRPVIEKIVGHEVHEKTMGMTLYRLSKDGEARRDGLVWYCVPQGAK
jgi:hypothetical protein